MTANESGKSALEFCLNPFQACLPIGTPIRCLLTRQESGLVLLLGRPGFY